MRLPDTTPQGTDSALLIAVAILDKLGIEQVEMPGEGLLPDNRNPFTLGACIVAYTWLRQYFPILGDQVKMVKALGEALYFAGTLFESDVSVTRVQVLMYTTLQAQHEPQIGSATHINQLYWFEANEKQVMDLFKATRYAIRKAVLENGAQIKSRIAYY